MFDFVSQTDALFNRGMQPCLYSKRLAKEQRRGWERAGTNMKYHSTKLAAAKEDENKKDGQHRSTTSVGVGAGAGGIGIGAVLLQAVQ